MYQRKQSLAFLCLAPGFLLPLSAGESSVVLGAGLDELLRHVPQLRPDGVDVVIRILRRQCMLGGEPNPPKPPPAPPAAPAAAAGEAAAGEAAPVAEAAAEAAGQGAAAMETDAAAQSASQPAAPAEAAMEVEAQAQQAPAEQEAEPMTAEPAAAVPAPAEAHATAAAAGAVAAEPAGEQAQPAAVQGGAAGEAAAENEEEEEVEEVLAEDPEAETYLVECVTYTGGLGRQRHSVCLCWYRLKSGFRTPASTCGWQVHQRPDLHWLAGLPAWPRVLLSLTCHMS